MPYKIVYNNEIVRKQYELFKNDHNVDEKALDKNYKDLRKFFLDKYNSIKDAEKNPYMRDLKLALKFYQFINGQQDFLDKYKANYQFWRYIAVYVIPDIIEDRFGVDALEHFYKKNVRVYPYTLYWYIHLSWQGSEKETFEILKDHNTDSILQIVERPLKKGINVELFRKIMKEYSTVNSENKTIIREGKKTSLLRRVFKKLTSKLAILKPEIYPGGEEAFAKMVVQSALE